MKKSIAVLFSILLLAVVSVTVLLVYENIFPKTMHEGNELHEYYIAGNTIPSMTAVVGPRKMINEASTEGYNFVSMNYAYQSNTAKEDLEAYLAALVEQVGYTESLKQNPDQTSLSEALVWQAYRRSQDGQHSTIVQLKISNGGYTINYSMIPLYSAPAYDFGDWRKPKSENRLSVKGYD